MTSQKPRPLRPRLVSLLVVVIVILATVLPVTAYFVAQRYETHTRWGAQTVYAQDVYIHLNTAWGFMTDNSRLHWSDNETGQFTSYELTYASFALGDLQNLDTSHLVQLSEIQLGIDSVTACVGEISNSTARFDLATRFNTIGHDIVNAYWNFLNYTTAQPDHGPSFWYSGPIPPDENLLQNAATVAVSFQRGPVTPDCFVQLVIPNHYVRASQPTPWFIRGGSRFPVMSQLSFSIAQLAISQLRVAACGEPFPLQGADGLPLMVTVSGTVAIAGLVGG